MSKITRVFTVLFVLAGLTLLSGQPALVGQPPRSAPQSPRTYDITGGIVSLLEVADVSSQDNGVLMKLTVKEGDQVEGQQSLGFLTRLEAQHRLRAAVKEVEVAELEASNDVRVKAARASAKVADAKYRRAANIRMRNSGAVTITEIEELKLSAEHAKLQINLADHEHQIAKLTKETKEVQRDLAKVMLDRREIRAPFAGEITDLYLHQGEWLEQGKTLLRIINLERLKIEGFVDAEHYLPSEIEGREVKLYIGNSLDRHEYKQPDKDGDGTPDPIFIAYAKNEIENNGTFRIKAEVWNTVKPSGRDMTKEWILIPGQSIDMKILVAP